MSVTFGAAGAGTNSTITVNVAHPTGITSAHYLTLSVFTGDPTNSTPTGPTAPWVLLGTAANTDGTFATADSGPRRATVWGKPATGSESGTVAVSNAGGTGSVIVGRIDRWTKTLTHWDVEGFSQHYELANGTQTSLPFAGVRLETGNMLRIATASPDDTATISGQAFAATGITFGAFTEQSDTGTTGGNDIRSMTGQAAVTAGSGTVTVTYTNTQDESVGGVLVVLRDTNTLPAPYSSEIYTGSAWVPATTQLYTGSGWVAADPSILS